MFFSALKNAECATRMPELNFEHPKTKHPGYLAIKAALTSAFKSDFCTHAEAVCGEDIKESIPKINVCMWEKKSVGTIERPSIVYGYPRYISAVDNVTNLGELIHYHIRNFRDKNFFIYWDGNLYIKETPEPYDETLVSLAALYYIAHLRGKFDEMKEYLKKTFEPVIEKVKYVPTARMDYDADTFITEKAAQSIKQNGQGVDLNSLMRTRETYDKQYRDYEQQLTELREKSVKLQQQIDMLISMPDTCPAREVIDVCLKALKDICVKISLKSNAVSFTLESQIVDFDKEDVKRQWENPKSYLQTHVLGFDENNTRLRGMHFDNESYKEFIRKLVREVFIEEKYRIIVTNVLDLQLFPLAYNWRSYTDEPAPTGFTNPHLYWYVCWSEAMQAINNCFKNRNYDQIPIYLKSVLSQVSFGNDAAPIHMINEWYKALKDDNPTRAFVDKDGYAYTIKELYELQ